MSIDVYDDQKEQDDLAHQDERSFNSHPGTSESDDFDKWEDELADKKTLEPEDLAEAETDNNTGETAPSDEADRISALSEEKDYLVPGGSGKRRFSGLLTKKRAATGGTLGAILTLLAVGSFSLPGLKLMHIAENIEEKFFGNGEMVTEKWADKVVSNYVKKYLLPNLVNGTCNSTKVDRNCVSVPEGAGLTTKLYRGWRDSKFETKLWENQGLAFEKRGDAITMITREGSVDLPGDFTTSTATLGEVSGRNNIRRGYLDAFGKETRFKDFYKKYKVGKFLERKYNIRRCVIFCKTRDNVADWKDNKKLAYKTMLIQRVITPRSEALGLIIECFINGGCSDRDGTDEDGARQTRFERQVDQKLSAYAAKFGQESTQKIVDDANALLKEASEKGSVTRAVIERLVGNVFGEATGKVAGKAIPVVGWIDFIANGVDGLKQANTGLKKWIYVTQAATVVSTFALFATQSDEQRAGQVDLETLGSFVDALGSDNGASAEEAPLYDYYFGSQQERVGLFDFGGGKAYAASSYTCNDGTPVSGYACPEDSLKSSLAVGRALDVMVTNPAFSVLGTVSDWWLSTAGKAIRKAGDLVGGAIAGIPGVDSLAGLMSEVASPMFLFFGNYLAPSIFPEDLDNISGAKTMTAVLAGGNVAGNDTMHYVLGGREITPVERAELDREQLDYKEELYASLPLKDKLFNIGESQSLASQFAMTMPLTSSPTTFFARNPIINPSYIANAMTGMFGIKKATAAGEPIEDPLGITQYGWVNSDPILAIDPDTLTAEYCDNYTQNWTEDVYVSEETGMDVHRTANPCKLNEVVIDSLLGVKETDSIATETSTASVGSFVAGIDPPLESTANDPCPISANVSELGVVSARRGTTPLSIKLCKVHGYSINANVAKNYDEMYTAFRLAGFTFNGNAGNFRSSETQAAMYAKSPNSAAPAGQSNHELGLAVDVSCATTGGSQAFTPWMPGKQRGLDDFQRAITEHPCLNWLHVNSRKYGLLLQCDGQGRGGGEIAASSGGCETWHLSPTGK